MMIEDLLVFAKELLTLEVPEPGGTSMAAQLRHVAKQTGGDKLLPMIAEIPPEIEHVWQIFLMLHQTRGGGFGPGPITFGEMDSWCRLHDIRLEAWEIQAIRQLDIVWLTVTADKMKKK